MKKDKSMIETAYDFLVEREKLPVQDRELPFAELYAHVVESLEMTEDERKANIGRFYSDLSFDGRFVELKDNHWDLRSNHTYSAVHIDVKDIYSDIDTPNDDEEEKKEEESEDLAEEGEGDEEEGENVPEDVVNSINRDNLY